MTSFKLPLDTYVFMPHQHWSFARCYRGLVHYVAFFEWRKPAYVLMPVRTWCDGWVSTAIPSALPVTCLACLNTDYKYPSWTWAAQPRPWRPA